LPPSERATRGHISGRAFSLPPLFEVMQRSGLHSSRIFRLNLNRPALTLSVCTEFVDELPELCEIYAIDLKPQTPAILDPAIHTPTSQGRPSPAASVAVASIVSEGPTYATSWTPGSLYSGTDAPTRTKRRQTNETDRGSFHSIALSPGALSCPGRTQSFKGASPATCARREDAIDSLLRAADYSRNSVDQTPGLFASPSQNQVRPFPEVLSDTPGVWPHASLQEVCLMRYFIDELACWVLFLT
jgi:hypothetical protein